MKTINHSPLTTHRSRLRHGVVLLVILGMLAVLALIGIAFTTYSAQEENSSTIFRETFQNRQADLTADTITFEALGQLIADTSNPLSVLRGHSLLRDMYGNDNDMGFGPDGRPGVAFTDDDGDGELGSPVDAQGRKIADGMDNNGNGVIDEGIDNLSELGWPGSDDAPNGVVDVYEFFQRAFNGPGDRGYLTLGPDGLPGTAGVNDDGNGIVDGVDLARPGPDGILGTADDIAPNGILEPDEYDLREVGWPGTDDVSVPIDFNFVFNQRNPERQTWRNGEGWMGGFDEDYDYADWNNMFLAAVRADGTVLTPSFHRPGYLANTDWSAVTNVPGMGRRIILRPRPVDHLTPGATPPQFGPDGQPGQAGIDDDGDGTIDNLSELGWPGSDDIGFRRLLPGTPLPGMQLDLDVDNMGLGRPDSVWVDLGFPVQRTIDGRKFKPMAAFLVIDMDGKLNLNAHGNLTYDKIDNSMGNNLWVYPNAAGDSTPDSHSDIAPGTAHAAGNILPAGYTADQPMGSGASVSEVNLQNLFNPLFTSAVPGGPANDSRWNEYRWLLEGQWRPGPDTMFGTADDIFVPGRWGEPQLLATATKPRAGATYIGGPAATADDNTPGYFAPRGNVLEGRPATSGGVHRTPADFDGNGVLGTNMFGKPVFLPTHARLGWGGSLIGWPAPITAGHTGFPEGLDEATEFNPYVTRGSDAPFTPAELELLLRVEDVDGSSLMQFIPGIPYGRLGMLAQTLFDFSNPLNRRRRMMLTTESWDLSRPNYSPVLGWQSSLPSATNPRQHGNGVFPFANAAANTLFIRALPEAIRGGRRLDITPRLTPSSGLPTNIPTSAKYELAKSLYMVMWVNSVTVGAAGPIAPTPARAKRIAQFCANVVDFIDTEAQTPDLGEVMMPFVYDINPFINAGVVPGVSEPNGWDVVSDPTDTTTGGADRGIVWATEGPRLVINEVLAYENPIGTMNLWIELYNPSLFPVELNGTNKTYQIVVQDAGTPATVSGEPTSVAVGTDAFDFNGPPISVPPGGYVVIGPGGTGATIPLTLGGGPFGTPLRYSPTAPISSVPLSGFLRVYLRRLANPYQMNDPAAFPNSANPYITVDQFFQKDPSLRPATPPPPPPISDLIVYDDTTYSMSPGLVLSRERRSLGVDYTTFDPAPIPLPPPPNLLNQATHSIGIVNTDNARDVTGYTPPTPTPDPWPMLTFNDRPFMSPAELLLVPATSPQELTSAIAFPLTDPIPPTPLPPRRNFYAPLPAQKDNTAIKPGSPSSPLTPFRELGGDEFLFGHLLNFFREVGMDTPPLTPALAPNPGYYRLFEYVEVPSRVNGAQTSPLIAGDTSSRGRNERLPGKLNINTILEPEVFEAALNNHPMSMDATNGSWISPASQIPTFDPAGVQVGTSRSTGAAFFTTPQSELFRRVLVSIANPDPSGGAEPGPRLFTANDRPFRSFGVGAGATTLTAASQLVPPPLSIQSTFMRGFVDPVSGFVPLFEDTRGTAALPNPPPGLTAPPNDLKDYPSYRLQVMQKMSNVFTTRSNVYAVWITVGFFEVLSEDPGRLGPVINAPPQLGAEVNLDIGQNIRHRAFFVVDRTRATGYAGPPRNSKELQDILGQVVIHSRIIE